MDQATIFPAAGSAVFSDCGLYRYTLRRNFGTPGGPVNFLMLNPSTADAIENDPTVERCERRAREWGYSGLIVTNIFAFRSTDPNGLFETDDPVGPENDLAIIAAAGESDAVVCAWGTWGNKIADRWNPAMMRGPAVLAMLRGVGVNPMALHRNRDGSPGHPLYRPYTDLPRPYHG